MLNVLTPNQVDSYRRDGLLFPLPALNAAEVEYFRACHDELDHHLGGRPTAVEKGDRHLDVKWICDLATHPRVLDAVEDIIGPDVLIHSSTIFTKYAHDEKFVSWHQDSHYWGLSEPRLVSAWIALTDSTIDNGCLRVLPGTHTRAFDHLEEPQQTNILTRGHTVSDTLDVDQAIDHFAQALATAARHFFSFERNSSKKFSTTTKVGMPNISAQLFSRTMRKRWSSRLSAKVPLASDPARTRAGI